MNLEEKIDAYLNGRLSEADQIAFESEIAQDPQLADEVRLQQEAQQLLLADRQRAFKTQLQSIAAQQKPQLTAQLEEAPVVALWQRNWVRIAAAVAILIGLSFIFWPSGKAQSYPQMADAYFEPYPDRLQIRGDDSTDLVQEALLAYNRQDYAEAVRMLQALQPEDEHYLLGRLYHANAHLAMKQPAPAIEILAELHQIKQSAISEITAWYLALAYLQADQAAQAKVILEEISQDEASIYGERAKEILASWN